MLSDLTDLMSTFKPAREKAAGQLFDAISEVLAAEEAAVPEGGCEFVRRVQPAVRKLRKAMEAYTTFLRAQP